MISILWKACFSSRGDYCVSRPNYILKARLHCSSGCFCPLTCDKKLGTLTEVALKVEIYLFGAPCTFSSPHFQSSLSFIVSSLFMSDGTMQICIVAKLWSVRARCFNFISAAVYLVLRFSRLPLLSFSEAFPLSIAIPRFFESRTCRPGRISVCVFAVRSRIFLYW